MVFLKIDLNNYSETCLKRTCSIADTYLKRTNESFEKFQFTDLSLINLTCLKQTLNNYVFLEIIYSKNDVSVNIDINHY